MIDALRARFEVKLVTPTSVALRNRAWRYANRASSLMSTEPALGRALVPETTLRELRDELESLGPDCIVLTHGYLAARLPAPVLAQAIVDHPNLETQRFRSLAGHRSAVGRLAMLVEARKADRWEPRVAAQAWATSAVTQQDAEWLRRAGARRVITVPNAATASPLPSSPPESKLAVFYGDLGYEPNADAIARFCTLVWPAVQTRVADASLAVAGRNPSRTLLALLDATGASYVGVLDDLATLLRRAALVVAPVTSGGGTQLKVLHAVATGRIVVATPFASRALAPFGLERLVDVCDTDDELARTVASYLADTDERRRREHEIQAGARLLPDWRTVSDPLVRLIEEHHP
jgi:hypothetical protein